MDTSRFDQLRHLPLEPIDYCQRWVTPDPSRNYRQVCINAIANATGLSPNTIKDWGKNFSRRPQYATRLLRYADLINQFKQLSETGEVKLPSNFPRE
ncbi:MAG: hypothetical protein SAJ37_15465 [Oscillatoria sp. PMC 1068.18]|nr:hypothetical protein [Oscillatoria sp. PMC 1068.18]